jgi:DNA-binding winged helix-turn-helix (wHTH) protein
LRGGDKILLRAKSLAVLTYLVEHPHRLLSKEELTEAVWPGAKVVNAALRVSIQEIRKALGDHAGQPKFIETVGKSGYRFVAAVGLKFTNNSGAEATNIFVGRAAELQQLEQHAEIARGGKRQLVIVTGELGIGKSTLIDVFTDNLAKTGEVVVARGQCIEQYGAGEAYLPVLDALEQLCRAADAEATIALLRRLAPSWLIDLPTLISPQEREALARQCLGITTERRLREVTAFFEEIAKNRRVVVIFDNLQWVDPSTLAWISFLARRRAAARLLLIGTCRSGEPRSAGSYLNPPRRN